MVEGARTDAQRSADAILNAARDVLARDPSAGLGVIAERAGVHRATVYRHFPTREALVDGLYAAYLEDLAAGIRKTDLDADDLWPELEGVTRRIYEVTLAWRAYAWAPHYSAATRAAQPELAAIMSTLMGALQMQGRLRQDLSVRELAVTWGAPIQFLAARIAEGDTTVDRIVDYVLRLLSPA